MDSAFPELLIKFSACFETVKPSSVLVKKFMTVRNWANSMNSSRRITPLPSVSKSDVNLQHFSSVIGKACSSVWQMPWITGSSSIGSSSPERSASKASNCSWQASSNFFPVRCCTSQSGKKGMMLHNRSLSTSIIWMKSWKVLSAREAFWIMSLPSCVSSQPATVTNWTICVNSVTLMRPSWSESNMSANFLHCSAAMLSSCVRLSSTMTGIRSSEVRSPRSSLSRDLNFCTHKSTKVGSEMLSRRVSGTKWSTSSKLLLAASRVMSKASTFEHPAAARCFSRILSRTLERLLFAL
mmetsp:Transcript_117924/g.279884  ORF Transcript_117924/g.279884 Transcript_117924/m.279884 type:complete len:296 (-) Transcript_117924:688-1575(-)